MLPGYAPEWNPVEQLCNRLEWGHFANAAPRNACELLSQTVRDHVRLRSFWNGAEFPLHKRKLQR